MYQEELSMRFQKKPKIVEAVQFLGEDDMFPWLKTCGIKLPKQDRVGKFWNQLHDNELEVEYGDWIVYSDMSDLYPIKDSVLKRDFIKKQ